ncbi:MAG: M61 family peptidase, partial [Rhodanobacter sp.]|nr:M61 family peptidase [Rhodanobacter sp.]
MKSSASATWRVVATVAAGIGMAVAARAQVPAPEDVAYPGTLRVAVDATDLARRIFRVHETIPVQPGPLTLLYPQWLPGSHSPRGPIDKLAGLAFSANGQPIAWQRDPLKV